MHRTAKELNLPAGDAVMRDGRVTVLPAGHGLDRIDRNAEVQPYAMPLQAGATSQVVLKTTYRDRADGYRRATEPLSYALAIVGAIIAIKFQSAPIFSLLTLGYAFSGFVVAWLAGWTVHSFVSPDGSVILQALLAHRFLSREQAYRHSRRNEGRG